jgi:hypothetical protein
MFLEISRFKACQVGTIKTKISSKSPIVPALIRNLPKTEYMSGAALNASLPTSTLFEEYKRGVLPIPTPDINDKGFENVYSSPLVIADKRSTQDQLESINLLFAKSDATNTTAIGVHIFAKSLMEEFFSAKIQKTKMTPTATKTTPD